MPSNYKTVINFRDGIQVDTDDLISNNGLVGIGSTIPRQQLDVRGNIIVSENSEFNNVKVTGITSFQNDVAVSSGSSVGIGTSVPEAAFQVGIGTTGFTVDEQGNVTAVEYFGSGANFTIGKRVRDLYNKVTVSDVIFDSPIGPEVLATSPEGKFQKQIRKAYQLNQLVVLI